MLSIVQFVCVSLFVATIYAQSCGNLEETQIDDCIDMNGYNRSINPLLVKHAKCGNEICDCKKWLKDNNVSFLPARNPCRCRASSARYIFAHDKDTDESVKCTIVTDCDCIPLLE